MQAKTALAAGDTTTIMCSQCESEQTHKIIAATKQGAITNAVCETCETATTFARGVKTGVTVGGKGKAASPYDRSRKYKKGQTMTHTKFGRGEVTAVVEPHKIDVLFGDQTRRLVHEQSAEQKA